MIRYFTSLPLHPIGYFSIDISIYIAAAWLLLWMTSNAITSRHLAASNQIVHCVGATSSLIHYEGLCEYQCNLMIFLLYPVAWQPAPFCLKSQLPKRNITSLVRRMVKWSQGMQCYWELTILCMLTLSECLYNSFHRTSLWIT